jgi:hypothetical protein
MSNTDPTKYTTQKTIKMSNTDLTKYTTQKTIKMSNTDPTKYTTQKTIKMSNTDPTKYGCEPMFSRRVRSSCYSYSSPANVLSAIEKRKDPRKRK